MPDLPDLILHPTRAYGRPPYIGKKALLQAGWIDSRASAIQSILDRSLNRVAPDKVRVSALFDKLLMTSLHVGEMRSGDPIDRQWGYVAESDIAFWALVRAETPGRTGLKALYWTPIYMFVDDAAATAGGREIFGFPKIHARINRPGTGESDFGLCVSIRAFAEPDPDQAVQDIKVIEIAAGGHAYERAEPDTLLNVPWTSDKTLTDGLVPALAGRIRLPTLEFPVLQMKQVPSITDPYKADYQALVALRMKTLKVHAAGRARGGPNIKIASPKSVPIAETLATLPVQKLEFPVWLVQDFETATGEVLAEARGR